MSYDVLELDENGLIKNRHSVSLFVFCKIGVIEVKALDLVGHIVTYSEQVDRPATNLRLQVLLYRIQQEYTKRYGRPAFDDEMKYAGEIVYYPDVYYEYVCYTWRWYIINVPLNPNVEGSLEECVKDVVQRFAGVPTWKMIEYIIEERRNVA